MAELRHDQASAGQWSEKLVSLLRDWRRRTKTAAVANAWPYLRPRLRQDELPVHLVVLVERAALLAPFPAINQSSFAGGPSIYPFVQNLLLAIRGEGLVASLTMLLNNQEDDVKQLLAVPDDFSLAAHVGVGWPAQAHLTRLWRRLVEDFTSIDRFGRGRPTGAKGL